MKTKIIFLFFVLILTVALITACSRVTPQPTGLPDEIGTPSSSENSDALSGLPDDIGTPDITGNMIIELERLPSNIGTPNL
ncbi:MAG: hypothetical protein V1663_04850 [archaeon]